jgi:anti-sigma factor RsiW
MNNVNVNDDMPNPASQELAEQAWRRALTPDEQARLRQFLAAHPEARSQWESEAALTRALHRLPPAPVSSNFTALVLQAVQRAPAPSAWRRRLEPASWLPAGWMPRLALGVTMVCISLLTVSATQTIQRQRMARNLASVGALATLQPVDWLQNFQTIESLSRVQVADDVLLQVLQ